MTQTVHASVTATATATATAPASAPARLPARTLSAGGFVAGPLFLGVGAIQGLTRDGFDFTRNAISQLSLGALGWIQVTSFLLTGVLVLAGSAGLRRTLRDAP